MGTLEQKIKAFVRDQGVEVVGVAGPERLDGPPSLDPTYIMKGARSIVSLVLPMEVEAIYDFLSKKSPVPHNLDQMKMNEKMHRICEFVAGYIRSLGYHAKAVPVNNRYRRSPYPFATLPDFSHRFGAIAAGIAGQGWSGNVMTAEYGAAIYLGTVVTDAVLESDPLRYSPRHFIDNYCKTCKLCDKSCPGQMFREREEEYILLNGALHPRGKRNDINLCAASCFGLHSISADKKFSSWGFRIIKPWMDNPVDKLSKMSIIGQLVLNVFTTGESAPRYSAIRSTTSILRPEEDLNEYLDKHPENLGHKERWKLFNTFAEEKLGVPYSRTDRMVVCGHCSLLCGPTLEESAKRYKLLTNGGLVVQGPDGDMVHAQTYEEAAKLYTKYLPGVTAWDILKDGVRMGYLFTKWYSGFEPKSFIGGVLYARLLKKAVRNRVKGHAASVN